MPSYLSTKNRTEIPLQSLASFIGGTEYVLNYTNCDISIIADTNCRVKIYGSISQSSWAVIFDAVVPAGDQFFQTLLIYHPYLYSSVENLDAQNQTYINYQLIYREHSHAFVLTEATLTTPIEVIDKQRITTLAWTASTVSAGDNSTVCDMTSSKFTNLSIYGNTNMACDLTLQFSPDKVNWFNTQYTFTISAVGGADFGASIACSAKYARLKRTDTGVVPATISAVIEAT